MPCHNVKENIGSIHGWAHSPRAQITHYHEVTKAGLMKDLKCTNITVGKRKASVKFSNSF